MGGGGGLISKGAYNWNIFIVSRQKGLSPEGLISGGAYKRHFTVSKFCLLLLI